MTLQPLPLPLAGLHFAYTTRRVVQGDIAGLLTGARKPEIGQLVLARVNTVGQHRKIELISGRKAWLYPGDHVVLAYGNRYAPDQFEAVLPGDLGECQMVAGGGLAAREISRNTSMKPATTIQPLGVLANFAGHPINLRDYALRRIPRPSVGNRPQVFFVCGTSMNSGKTHTAHELVRGLRRLGIRTGAAKVTGTGAGNDPWRLKDCGAEMVLDFTDAGYPSTYLVSSADIEVATDTILSHLAAGSLGAVVVEIADGIGQFETAALLESETLRHWCDAVMFAAADPLAARAGVAWLRARRLPVVAVSGLMTAEPLVQAEAESMVDVPVLSAEQLAEGTVFQDVLLAAGLALPVVAPAPAL